MGDACQLAASPFLFNHDFAAKKFRNSRWQTHNSLHDMKTHKIQEVSALGMLIFGCALTAAGFAVAPVGQVHDSVLWVLGQSLVYAGSILGGKLYVDGVINHKMRSHDK